MNEDDLGPSEATYPGLSVEELADMLILSTKERAAYDRAMILYMSAHVV